MEQRSYQPCGIWIFGRENKRAMFSRRRNQSLFENLINKIAQNYEMNRTGQLLCAFTCIINWFGEVTVDIVNCFVAHDWVQSTFSVANFMQIVTQLLAFGRCWWKQRLLSSKRKLELKLNYWFTKDFLKIIVATARDYLYNNFRFIIQSLLANN